MTDLKRDQPCPNPQDPPPAVAHDQQSIKQPERDCRHDKEVHGDNAIRMVAKEPSDGGPLLRAT
jgi:hypothetical protein